MEAPMTEDSTMGCRSRVAAAIRELKRGCEAAVQLHDHLLQPSAGVSLASSEAAREHVSRIIQSFADAISTLSSRKVRRSSPPDRRCQRPVAATAAAPLEEGESPPARDRRRRGCKRSRRPSTTWTKISATPFVDEYGWRKYGQKEILDAKFPRSYFRCTHRNDQGCLATKHVQRLDSDPSSYQITYIGQHTCKDLCRTPQLVLAEPSSNLPFSLSFEPNFARKTGCPAPSLLQANWQQREEMLKEKPTPVDSTPSSGSSADFLVPDFSMFESCGPVTELPEIASEHGGGDVFSGSSPASEMDFHVDVDFDEIPYFHVGEIDLM